MTAPRETTAQRGPAGVGAGRPPTGERPPVRTAVDGAPTTSQARPDPAISAIDLVKTYKGGVRALDGVSFAVEAGTVFGLLGPNGAGKSTVVKILTTLSRPDSGQAFVAGVDVLRQPGRVRCAIGCIAQKSGVDLEATGRENLALQGRLYGLGGRELKGRIAELLDGFGLASAADRVTRTYSGGMQRKLDVAMGLVHRPRVLFLDEPTTGLDPEARAEMWAEIARLTGEEGLTILLTTHYLEEADKLAQRLAIVDRGRVVAEGSPEELKGELRGDAIHIELGEPVADGRVQGNLAGVHGVRDVVVEGRSLHARADSGATAVPAALAALESSGVKVASVTVARPSLDDVYLRHTGRSFDETDQGWRRAMTAAIAHAGYMTQRHLRALSRQPWYIAISLVQPVIWLLLFGALFKRVVEIPGFGARSYITFLTPGVVVMTALFSGGWSGMGLLEDLDRGVMDRLLVSPVRRGALISGRLAYQAVVIVIQSLIILVLGRLLGARFPGGLAGAAALLVGAVLLGTALSSLSNALALTMRRREESVIAAVQFVALPLTFLSSGFMDQKLAPLWIQRVARVNPVNWAVEAGRGGLGGNTDWMIVLSRIAGLLLVALVCGWLATRAFRAYQRSI